MPLAVAGCADFSLASAAPALRTIGISIMMDVDRSDPLSTSSRGTVESVLSGEFVILLVPKDLESIVKEILDVL